MVIEGIITTENGDGSMHVAPIGPHVNPELTSWTLKPFQSSVTFANLRTTSRGVFHVVDDSLLMAAAVLGICNPSAETRARAMLTPNQLAELIEAEYHKDRGWILDRSCGVYALSVSEWDVSAPRAIASCLLESQVQVRPFWGWNRASHSILELAIVASRVHLLDPEIVVEELNRHKIIIEKTAGARELAAWELLRRHLSQ
jgi:uncharacterized protein